MIAWSIDAARASGPAFRLRKVGCEHSGRLKAYGLLDRRFRHLSLVYDERFAPTYGPWRAVVPTVVDRFLACGLPEHGFAQIRCDACAHEYLLAFSCQSRYFCSGPTASTAGPPR